jgi:DnaJ-class molecular chaperone
MYVLKKNKTFSGFGGGPGGPGGGQRFSFNMGGGDPGGGSGGFGGFGDIFGSMFGDMGGGGGPGGPGGPGGGGPNMGGGGRRGPGMGGMGGMGGGGGGARRRAPPRQPSAPPTKVDFSVPLTDLLRDSTAKVRHGGRAHQVKVPAGSLEGAEFPAQGDPSVLFVLRAPADESRFTREPGSGELVFRAKVSLTEALSGKAVVKVPLLEGGRVIQVPVYSVISPQTVKMLPAQGLPRPPKAKGGRRRAKEPERGDLRIKFDIEFPAKLTPGQFKRIKAVLEEVEDKK